MAPRFIDGIAGLVPAYDDFLVDLWGCVHNGVEPYPGAVDCLRRLRAAGKRVVFLSNAPRPAAAVAERLAGVGVPVDSFDAIVSSGDATVRALNERSDAWHAALGRRFFHVGPERDRGVVDAVADKAVDFEDADYLLNTGLVDDDGETVEAYRPMLRRALARHLPMVCANPDLAVMRGERVIPCAGALARAYEAMGGEVRQHGKPHASIFDMAFQRLGRTGKQRVVVIGDGLATDIAGGRAYGIDSVWIAGGIHGAEVGFIAGAPLDRAAIARALAERGAEPSMVIAGLAW